jgi:conjugative relaxase-like TrwC/TraI family protein
MEAMFPAARSIMLSLSNLKAAQAETYYQADDYYTNEEYGAAEFHPQWFGQGATALGLTGDVAGEDFKSLLQGYGPDEQALFQRQVDVEKRRGATDYTFSAPKSVSVAALVQQDERVLEAHHRAVKTALSVLEERYVEARITIAPGDRRRVNTGNIISALFPHQTSRELDPQLHTHCVTINATQAPDGRWFSFSNERVISHQKLLGEVYQNELAYGLRQAGYEIQPLANGQFELAGYDPAMLDGFSKRRQQIKAVMERWQQEREAIKDGEGQPVTDTAARREAATLRSRQRKCHDIGRAELTQAWAEQVQQEGWQLPEIPSAPGQISSPSAQVIIDHSVQHCEERRAIFPREAVERFALEHHLGDRSFAEIAGIVDTSSDLIRIEPGRPAGSLMTTQRAIALEQDTIQLMRTGQGQVLPLATSWQMANLVNAGNFNAGQRMAVQQTLRSFDLVIGWQGVAGAGKTYALSWVKQQAEQSGYRVKGLAPSAEAASELGRSLQIETATVASHLLQSQQESGPQLWIVDEASLLGMKTAHDLLEKAQRQDARVILVGDTRQLSAVEAGHPFKSLQAAGMATSYLDESLRQQTRSLQQAVRHLAAGEIDLGIDELMANGNITLAATPAASEALLVQTYCQLPPEERDQTLILTSTREARQRLTQALRSQLQDDGELAVNELQITGMTSKNLTVAEAGYASHYEVGDVIVPLYGYRQKGVQADSTGAGLSPRQRYEVVDIQLEPNTLTAQGEDGQVVAFDPAKCKKKLVYQPALLDVAVGDRLRWTRNDRQQSRRNGQELTVAAIDGTQVTAVDASGQQYEIDAQTPQYLDYAWGNTIHSAQGKTADRVLVLAHDNIDQESFYVACSRVKHQLSIYTDSLEHLRQQAHRSRSQVNVTDYLRDLRAQWAAPTVPSSMPEPSPPPPSESDASPPPPAPVPPSPPPDPVQPPVPLMEISQSQEVEPRDEPRDDDRRQWWSYRQQVSAPLTGEALDQAIALKILSTVESADEAIPILAASPQVGLESPEPPQRYAERLVSAARARQVQWVCQVVQRVCETAGRDICGKDYDAHWDAPSQSVQIYAKGADGQRQLVLHQVGTETQHNALNPQALQAVERLRQAYNRFNAREAKQQALAQKQKTSQLEL